MTADAGRWTVVVPVKAWRSAKSRLAQLSEGQRLVLAQALARDTVETVLGTAGVLECVLVGERSTCSDMAGSGARCVEIPDDLGLDAALLRGQAAADESASGVCLLVADLPLLSSASLRGALAVVPVAGHAVVRDTAGSGTTMLASRARSLRPSFGTGSAGRHLATGATDLSDVVDPRLRCDLDEWADLADLTPAPGSRVDVWRRQLRVTSLRPVPAAGAAPLSLAG